jgi:hypothetical protein
VQIPPLQLVEQQSLPVAHESPSVLQALVPLGVGRAWQVVAQLPVQHSPGDAQAVPVLLQVAFAQRPLTQESEQHSLESAHAPPGTLQKAVVVHAPLLHAPEQHPAFEAQASPEPRQVETGGPQSSVVGSQ